MNSDEINFIQPTKFNLQLLKSNQPNLEIESFPNVLITVSPNDGKPYEMWNPQNHQFSTSSTSEFKSVGKSIPINGIIGSLAVGNKLWLGIIEEVELVGNILNHKIFTPKKISFIPLSKFHHNNNNSARLNLEEYKKLIERGGFYFSYSYPLWNHIQNVSLQEDNLLRKNRYVWNGHLNGLTCAPFIINLIRGNFQTIGCENGIQMTLISRIDKRNAGTRFTTRGLNQNGEAAIAVESEINLTNASYLVGFIQYRGSLPIVWQQKHQKFKGDPELIIAEGPQEKILDVHLNDLHNIIPGKHMLINLMGRNDEETHLSEKFAIHIKKSKTDVEYLHFPLGWGTKSLYELTDHLADSGKLNSFFYASVGSNNEIQNIIQIQQELIRTNCMDSIDRTAITQFGIVTKMLPNLLQALGNDDLKTLFHLEKKTFSKLCRGWTDMSNTLSLYYTNTGIINEGLIRQEFKNQPFSKNDALICQTRKIQNKVYDPAKKWILDQFLNLTYTPSPLPTSLVPTRHLTRWSKLFKQIELPVVISSKLLESIHSDELRRLQTIVKNQISGLESLQGYCTRNNLKVDLVLRSLPYAPWDLPRL